MQINSTQRNLGFGNSDKLLKVLATPEAHKMPWSIAVRQTPEGVMTRCVRGMGTDKKEITDMGASIRAFGNTYYRSLEKLKNMVKW